MKNYKIIILVFLCNFFSFQTKAQLGIGTNSPNVSAMLDITSTNKGFLLPRMTNSQKNNISNPAVGLTIFCTNCGTGGLINIFDGSSWVTLDGNNSDAPTVTTNAITAITHNSASSGVNINSIGSSNVTAKGVCWSTSANPTTANSKTNNTDITSSAGSFTYSLTSLTSNTTYYVRAYATNSTGTTYGDEISFTTSIAPTLAGSLSFSTNQYLTLSNPSPGIILGSGAFTVEGCIYNTGTFAQDGLFATNNNLNAARLYFNDNRTVVNNYYVGNGSSTSYVFTNAISSNAWHYFIYNRNAITKKTAVFIDGVRNTGTIVADNNDYSGAADIIGSYYGGSWTGNITNLRVTVGTAIYDSEAASGTYTNPNSPLTTSGNTKLLLFGNSLTNDAANVQTNISNTGVTISTSKPF